MSIWQNVQRWWMTLWPKKSHTYALEETLHLELNNLALQENRTPDEMTTNVLSIGLSHFQNQKQLHSLWESFSAREKDVTAYTCLGLTNRQMAYRLGLSVQTIKSYLQNTLNKSGFHSKTELRLAFSNWDFSAWEKLQR